MIDISNDSDDIRIAKVSSDRHLRIREFMSLDNYFVIHVIYPYKIGYLKKFDNLKDAKKYLCIQYYINTEIVPENIYIENEEELSNNVKNDVIADNRIDGAEFIIILSNNYIEEHFIPEDYFKIEGF